MVAYTFRHYFHGIIGVASNLFIVKNALNYSSYTYVHKLHVLFIAAMKSEALSIPLGQKMGLVP